MKFIIVFVALFAIAVARPDVETVRFDSNVEPQGFKFGYETSDGTKHDSDGQVKNIGSEQEAIVVHGSFSYVDPEGKTHSLTYVADENGYQPQGEDIPIAPEV